MLGENIKSIRKSKGLTQNDLAIQLNVVRQTISKWENGLSVPDSDMLIDLSKVLDTSVSALLGENIITTKEYDINDIANRLEAINLKLAQREIRKKKILHKIFIAFLVVIVATFVILIKLNSPYLYWDYTNPEIAVVGTIFHGFERLFVRIAPIILMVSIIEIIKRRIDIKRA